MSTTAQTIFELTMQLMSEVSETTGETDIPDNTEYKNRALPILNMLGQECYPLSDTYSVTAAGTRPMLSPLTDFLAAAGLDDGLCRTVLPYGLAAHLLLNEGRSAEASFFLQRYEEGKAAARAIPRNFEAIDNIYGGVEKGAFSSW